jgi:methylthioribose-1-phosphate isomerase
LAQRRLIVVTTEDKLREVEATRAVAVELLEVLERATAIRKEVLETKAERYVPRGGIFQLLDEAERRLTEIAERVERLIEDRPGPDAS